MSLVESLVMTTTINFIIELERTGGLYMYLSGSFLLQMPERPCILQQLLSIGTHACRKALYSGATLHQNDIIVDINTQVIISVAYILYSPWC